ncbi:MAG: hypothetical protein JWM59_53 [Verrucomicrobiales bacterium]|nr:hypothetical protein [Verrucomicrobiales bacterium]
MGCRHRGGSGKPQVSGGGFPDRHAASAASACCLPVIMQSICLASDSRYQLRGLSRSRHHVCRGKAVRSKSTCHQ